MAGNTRGKLKEQFEGMHRNFEWITYHLQQSLELIKEHKPELSNAIKALHKGAQAMDELARNIYHEI
ncbi:unnamed protein product [marine sediment metagenome]|uniref:PhoU domain-containing protein n=1 Tax=marine sediment metagenome TaxID=412755 RepID=X1CD16_9ZZZZ